MYTTYPIAIVDTLNDHTGFILLALFVAFWALVIWNIFSNSLEPITMSTIILVSLVLLAYPAWISWHTGTITVPANKPVTVHMVEFWGETHSEQRNSGKTYTTVQVHNQYVAYRTPDGVVSFPFVSGVAYPETAILYKN